MGPQLPVAHSWIIERIGSIHCKIVLKVLVSKCQLATDQLHCNLFCTTTAVAVFSYTWSGGNIFPVLPFVQVLSVTERVEVELIG